MDGYYKMRRGWMDDEMFQSPRRDPFCHRAAWVWLVERAAFRDVSARFNGRDHGLRRGQMVTSLLDLASAWGWNTMKVARFLTALRGRGAIVTTSVTAATI